MVINTKKTQQIFKLFPFSGIATQTWINKLYKFTFGSKGHKNVKWYCYHWNPQKQKKSQSFPVLCKTVHELNCFWYSLFLIQNAKLTCPLYIFKLFLKSISLWNILCLNQAHKKQTLLNTSSFQEHGPNCSLCLFHHRFVLL